MVKKKNPSNLRELSVPTIIVGVTVCCVLFINLHFFDVPTVVWNSLTMLRGENHYFEPPFPASPAHFLKLDVGPRASFFYPIEDTLHSASYIALNEMSFVSQWMQYITVATSARLKLGHSQPRCIDVGSNGGFYSLLSRSLGCNTLAIDAQPHCLARLAEAAVANGFDTALAVRWTAVSDMPSLTVQVGATKCSGLWAVTESEYINQESSSQVQVGSASLMRLVSEWIRNDVEPVELLKIDVEGSEIAVLHSALSLFQAGRVSYCLVELAPARVRQITPWKVTNHTLHVLYASGYMINELELATVLAYFDPSRADPPPKQSLYGISKPSTREHLPSATQTWPQHLLVELIDKAQSANISSFVTAEQLLATRKHLRADLD